MTNIHTTIILSIFFSIVLLLYHYHHRYHYPYHILSSPFDVVRHQSLHVLFIEVKTKDQYWPLTCNTNHNTIFDMQAVNI